MKKDGFTLIELLGVITLLSVIALITVPVVKETLKDSKQKLYDEQITQIENGLKNWANGNIFFLPDVGDTVTLSLGQLKQTGNIEKELKNPKNSKCYSNESLLTITKYSNNYIYKVEELIDVNCNLIKDTPTITLNGDSTIFLNVGDTYEELEAQAFDSDGNDITSSIKKTGSVNTTTSGSYNITYSVTYGEKVMTAIRTVIVK